MYSYIHYLCTRTVLAVMKLHLIMTILCWLNAVPEGGITDDDIGDANVLNDVVAHPGHLKTFFFNC